MPQDKRQNSQWMDLAASGDDEAFGLLADATQDDLFRFALAHGLSGADAGEAVQETFLRAYRARKRWKPGADARAWLYGIAMNVVRETFRKRRREQAGLDLDLLAAAPVASDGPSLEPAELAKCAKAIEALPQRQREAVTCRFLRQMSV